MKTCIVVDDDFPQVRHIKSLISLRKELKCINSFVNPEKAIEYASSAHIDIAFLDIQMNLLDGIELSKFLPKTTLLIYITSSPNFALDAYNVDAIDYLLKPVISEKFNKAVDKAIEILNGRTVTNDELQTKENQCITLISDRKSYKILVDEINYIESRREYLCFHLIDNSKILSLGSLELISKKLPNNQFCRIHKSYIINFSTIKAYDAISVTIKNNKILNIGRVYKNNFKDFMKTNNNNVH